ncbi:MAG: Si-specific NAD(P)(+) transhydrogenase [Proteobacteria bacterium]|nr:Si-specific NAD(P)(+) transhydrogenase [Pseudomonadota bacterium]
MKFDLVVIGAGPAGWSAALQGAKLGLQVAVVEKDALLGGSCVHTGTLPSKTLRHTAVQLVQSRRAARIGVHASPLEALGIGELMGPKNEVIDDHERTIRSFFERNKIKVLPGSGSFVDPQHVRIATSLREEIVQASHVVIATGSRPRRPENFPFDDRVICDSDSILSLDAIPRSLAVLGGGVIGCEYACIFAALGVKVSLVDRRHDLLRFLDGDLQEALKQSMRRMGARLLLDEQVSSVSVQPGRTGKTARVELESGRAISAERLLVAAGRESNTTSLDLEKVGIPTDKTGLIEVNDHYQTTTENIYAVGDVVGFPALASTGMHQGRLAVLHAAGVQKPEHVDLPIAVYTIPELSMAGLTEEECRKQQIPYEVGYSRYAETPRGQILGDTDGMLKLIFRRDDRRVVGVHLLGQQSSEMVHIGMMLMHTEGTVDQLVSSVFNYPTLSEAYRVAALDGLNRL